MVKKIAAWFLVLLMILSFPSLTFADTESDDYASEEEYDDIYEDEPAYDDYEEYDEYDVSQEDYSEEEYSDEDADYSDGDTEDVSAEDDISDAADEYTEEDNDSEEDVSYDDTEASEADPGLEEVGNDEIEEQEASDSTGEAEEEDTAESVDETAGSEVDDSSDESAGDSASEDTQVTSEEVTDETETEAEDVDEASDSSYSTSVEGVPVREPDPVEINIYVSAKGIKQVKQIKAFALEDMNIYEEKDKASRIAGTLSRYGMCYILSDEGDGWYYVESGKVRGFAAADMLTQNEDIPVPDDHPDNIGNSIIELQGLPKVSKDLFRELAQPVLDPSENSAFLYTMTSAQRTVAYKIYGISVKENTIYDSSDENALAVGSLPKGGLVYILQRGADDCLFVESGDVRGFISKDDLKYGEDVQKEVKENGEESYSLASASVSAKDNKAYYYSLKSIDLRTPEGSVKDSVNELIHSLDGVKLSNIACNEESFVGLICESYGFDVGDSIEDYKTAGDGVDLADTGDILIITRKGASAEKAGIYAGDGEILCSEEGVLTLVPFENYDIISRRHVITSTRTLPASKDIREANAPEENYGEYLGSFYLTYYCPCAQCCDEATGLTATGVIAAEGETIAVDPSVIPYGTKVIINGHIFTAQDCGGGVKGNHIDIFVPYHEMCNQEIVSGEVYLLK